jgi:hypothetical protein
VRRVTRRPVALVVGLPPIVEAGSSGRTEPSRATARSLLAVVSV